MSIPDKLLKLNNIKRDFQSAICTLSENSQGAAVAGLEEIPAYIESFSRKTPLTPKDVNFIDYDGTLLYAYTKEEFIILNRLPNAPYHKGLVFDGWNWTLEDLLTYANNNIRVDVGAMYVTDDGATRLYIEKTEDLLDQPLYWYQNVANGVTIDWGDGSPAETSPTSSISTVNIKTHTYSAPGKYVIALTPAADCNLYIGPASGGTPSDTYNTIFGPRTTKTIYFNDLKKVELGQRVCLRNGAFRGFCNLSLINIPSSIDLSAAYGSFYYTHIEVAIIPPGKNVQTYTYNSCYWLKYACPSKTSWIQANSCWTSCTGLKYIFIPPISGSASIDNSAFSNLHTLEKICIPSTVTSIATQGFRYCYKLKELNLPDLTSLGTYSFQDCWSLSRIVIHGTLTSIPDYAFTECFGASLIDIPSTVTSIGTGAFRNCYRCTTLIVRATTPPTITNMNAFTGLVATQTGADAKYDEFQEMVKIYVPYSTDHSVLNAYKTATNWSTWADRFVELDENGNIPEE